MQPKDLRYRLLGRSGLRVSEVSLGTMTFGEEWGFGASKEESGRVFDAYVKRGGNFLDTANLYTEGTSEKWVGEMIAHDRDWFVVATKYTLAMRDDDPNAAGNARKNLVRSLDASLKRLGTDHVDLFWVHAWDYTTGIDEMMRALDDAVRAGKVLHVGISDAPAWVVSSANTMADLRGWSPFVALQIEYSLVERTAEAELLPMAREFGLTVTPWSPLGAGVLTGKYDGAAGGDGKRLAEGSRHLSERNVEIAKTTSAVANDLGCRPSQVAIAWLMDRDEPTIPIVGARRAEQLEENLDAAALKLPDEARAKLDEASRVPLGFPHDFLGMDVVADRVLGPQRARLSTRRAGR